jgi:hypothetical protein
MARWIFSVESDCNDPECERDFNDWYDNIHVPDVMKTGCFIKGTRFVLSAAPEKGRGKYLAIYEFETDNIAAFKKELEGLRRKIIRPKSPLMETRAMGFYQEIFSQDK